MIKKSILHYILVTVLLLVSLCGCTGTTAEPTEPEPTESENPYMARHALPWKYDARARAVENGTMEYYFMYSEDIRIQSAKGNDDYKWGDSCLIVFPNGETMLIDSGRAEYAWILTENLRRLGIEKIDYLLLSHCHYDHVGGAVSVGGVLDNFEIGKVYYPAVDQNYNYPQECKTDSLAPEDYEPLIAGDTRTFGEVTMTVLWPMPSHQGKAYTKTVDVNNTSLVVRLVYKEHSSLFTGDIYKSSANNPMAEEQMVDYYILQGKRDSLDADLLKVPHHGHSTSSGSTFLNTVTPTLSVATGYVQVPDAVRARYGDYTLLIDRELGYIHVTADGTDILTYESSLYQ